MKTSTSSRVFLVGPNRYLYWIPNPTVYFNLWDSWNGIVVNDRLFSACYSSYRILTNGHLAKTPRHPAVYIYDATWGGYRWIVNPTIFNRYAFSWGKIRVQSSVRPISRYHWNN